MTVKYGRILTVILAIFAPVLVSCQGTTTLREAAARHGLYVGAAINLNYLNNASDPLYRSTFLREYSLATAENECKFQPTEPQQDVFTFSACDTLLNFTTKVGHGTFRAHNTVWGSYNPTWLTTLPASQLPMALKNHVTTAVSRYSDGSAYCWDVVNEACSDEASGPMLKNNTWYPAVPDYVDLAFLTARHASSTTKLFYNDYSWEGYSSAKAAKVRELVEGMQTRGVPIDGVGMQMHIAVGSYPSFDDVERTMAWALNRSLEVHITEMDVICYNCTSARLQQQAAIYAGMLSACLKYPNCKSFETWGFTDLHTWLRTLGDVSPLPFDKQYQKKPAYFAMLNALQSSPVIARWR